MKDFLNLDGEVIDFDQDNFYPADGPTLVPMVAVSASQNIGADYDDQDNFYSADGVGLSFDSLPVTDEYSEARGKKRKGTLFDKKERARRRALREKLRTEKKGAKNEETKSRAELNKNVGKETASDIELAKALSSPNVVDVKLGAEKTPMSKTTKIAIGAGAVLLLVGIGFVIYKKMKKK